MDEIMNSELFYSPVEQAFKNMATQAEAVSGTDNEKMSTPASLRKLIKPLDVPDLRNYNTHETKTKGETTMALVNMNERTLKTYILVDEDKRLPVEKSLVHKFKNVMTEYDDETTIRQLLVDNDMNAIIEKHNKVRGETLNEEILQLNGSEVMLRPIKLKDLTWKCQ